MKLMQPYTFNGKMPIVKVINNNSGKYAKIPNVSGRTVDLYSNQGLIFKEKKKLDYRFFNKGSHFQVLENNSVYIFNFFIVMGLSSRRIDQCYQVTSQRITNLAFEGFFYVQTFSNNVKLSKLDDEIVFNVDCQYSLGEQLPEQYCGFYGGAGCIAGRYLMDPYGNWRTCLTGISTLQLSETFFRANSDSSQDCETSLKSGYTPLSETDEVFCSPEPATYSLFNSCNLIFVYKSGFTVSDFCVIGCTSRLVDRWG
mgnify:CR=1 FL=1